MKDFFRTFWLCIKNPRYWVMNDSYDKHLDRVLNTLMDRHPVIVEDRFYARFGKVRVWIANYPYASGTIGGRYSTKRASRLTIERLNNLVKAKQLELQTREFDEYDREVLGI